jgi:hypothetical protein
MAVQNGDSSAEGAAFSSHGRQAVVDVYVLRPEVRRTGISFDVSPK